MHDSHDAPQPMRKIHPAGLFEAICPFADEANRRYRIRLANHNGAMKTIHDPYAFAPLLSEYDIYLHGEGSHWKSYEKLGAQMRVVEDVAGVNFAVWAPNAQAVSVVGDFNQWDGRRHPMHKHMPSGIWEVFVPELKPGEKYKYRIKTQWGEVVEKSDPYGFAAEVPPATASIIADLSGYAWRDEAWMQQRRENPDHLDRPISIYEVHLGSWRRDESRHHGWKNYRDLAHELVEYCTKMGYTHIELLPVSEHPYSGSWGYQTVGYYAATSRHGSPQDFMYFVDYCHQHNLGVILDWVPAHFPRDGHGLRRFDGSPLYEHEDPRQGEHPDWGTMVFNYGRCEVRTFLLANALFWLDKYHIDGLRVDAVASMLYLDYSRQEGEWVPNIHGGRENLEAISFIKEFNVQAHGQYPGVLTIAEESTAWGGVSRPTYHGGLGFSLKWNMGWMNDTIRYFRHEPVHRQYHHDELTFSLIYAFHENFCLPLSHDEVVHGKGSLLGQMPGDLWQKFANLRLLYSYMWTHPGKKLLYMGSEWGQWHEWNHEAGLQWDLLQWDSHQGVQRLMADLNQLIRNEPALHEVDFEGSGFEWVDCHSREDSRLVYIRRARDPEDFVLVCCNFTPVVRYDFHVGVPRAGAYQEIFNSDSQHYGGSNVSNAASLTTIEPGAHLRPYALNVTLPPLSVVVLKPVK
ncbi:MAG: 1,4-alpha-glucan branching protein GlgB [Planctomycetes bacterium]|nr:1,4-alpha-glucan branching protein GlgB [Planctomycetota bacterium]